MSLILEPQQWAEEQFGNCRLGDKRRTRRLVRFAEQICRNPSGNTPMQTQRWSDCKAAYRLISQDDVTFEAITGPHYEATRANAPNTTLLLNDTTEIDYGYESVVEGLSPVGNGSCGFHLHNCLMVGPEGDVQGLAGQMIRHRKLAPKNESRTDRLKRDRESLLWRRMVEAVGPPPEGAQWIDVCDRGADDFEVYCQMLFSQHQWVVRAQHLHRNILLDGSENKQPLRDVVVQLPEQEMQYELRYRSKTYGARTATMDVRFGAITMPAPQLKSPWVRQQGISEITMYVVEAREANPPRGVEPLHWILYTSLPVNQFEQAWKVLEYYEKRWVVEEFHKALKTGCRLDERQYRSSDRLETIAGLLSIVAVRLLQLRSAARANPNAPAKSVLPKIWIDVLKTLRPRTKVETVGAFYRQLAGLGGHLLRKSDGEPGWLTIWRGFNSLNLAIQAIQNYNKCG